MITCHTQTPRLINLVYDLARPLRVSFRTDRPGAADVVVTTGALNGQIELLASRIGAAVIVLPEGAGYLAAKLKAGTWSTIVGLDVLKDPMARPPAANRKWGVTA